MSIRIGRKIGKNTFVSFGKSGTYVSTWIGDTRVSKFTPRKKIKSTNKTEQVSYSEPLSESEERAFIWQMILVGVVTISLFVSFAATGLFWESLAWVFGIHGVVSMIMWFMIARSFLAAVMWALPIIALFHPLGWIWWGIVFIGWFLI